MRNKTRPTTRLGKEDKKQVKHTKKPLKKGAEK